MENSYSEIIAPLLELEQLTNCKLRSRRRFYPRDIKDDEEFIPQLCPIPREQAAAGNPGVTNDISESEISSMLEGYEMISNKDYDTGPMTLRNETQTESSTAQTEVEFPDEYGVMVNLPTMESLEDLTHDSAEHTDLDHTTDEILYEEIADFRTEQSSISVNISKSDISETVVLTNHPQRRRAYSLGDAVADLRKLPWHIDYSKSHDTISLHSPSDKSTSKRTMSSVQTHHRNSQSLLERIKQHLKISSPRNNKPTTKPQQTTTLHEDFSTKTQNQQDNHCEYSDWYIPEAIPVGPRVESRGTSADEGVCEVRK